MTIQFRRCRTCRPKLLEPSKWFPYYVYAVCDKGVFFLHLFRITIGVYWKTSITNP